jgi:hypothetical protein
MSVFTIADILNCVNTLQPFCYFMSTLCFTSFYIDTYILYFHIILHLQVSRQQNELTYQVLRRRRHQHRRLQFTSDV